MMDVLNWVGQHPVLTIIALLIICSWTPFARK